VAALTPNLEISTQALFIQTQSHEFGLHQSSSLEQTLLILLAAVLGKRYVEPNGSTMAGYLDRCGRLEMESQLGPELPDAYAHGKISAEMCTHPSGGLAS